MQEPSAARLLPIHKVKIVSVFDRRVRYSLYSLLTILPAHQHRHLGQAERALKAGDARLAERL